MKLSSKHISIISAMLSLIMLSSMSIGIFMSVNNKVDNNITNVDYNDNETKNFFKNKNIVNNDRVKRIILDIDSFKYESLKLFTNWVDGITDFKFNINKINSNCIYWAKKIIMKNKSFTNIDNWYINFKYELSNETELKIDIRWALKDKLINKKSTILYWDKFIINLH